MVTLTTPHVKHILIFFIFYQSVMFLQNNQKASFILVVQSNQKISTILVTQSNQKTSTILVTMNKDG